MANTFRPRVLVSINNRNFMEIKEPKGISQWAAYKAQPSFALPDNQTINDNLVRHIDGAFMAVNVVNSGGKWVVVPNHQLLSKLLVDQPNSRLKPVLTHRELLAKGIVCMGNDPLAGVPVGPTKAGKRIRLLNTIHVIGSIPAANSIDVKPGLPDGIILVDRGYASRFELMRPTGRIVPLRNGDKLTGIVAGYLIKGTARIVDNLGCDLVLGEDAVKAKGCCRSDELYVQELASSRMTFNSTLNYDVWVYYPEQHRKRVSHILGRTYRYRVLCAKEEAPDDTHICMEDDTTYYYRWAEIPLRSVLLKQAPKEVYASMFMWLDNEGVLRLTPNYHRVMSNDKSAPGLIDGCIKALVRYILNAPVRGAWAVANWLDGQPADSVSIPMEVYQQLGRPKQVAVTRSPFITICRMNVRVHTDGPDFRVHPDAMKLFVGDFDGDLLEVVADKDIVEATPSYDEATNSVAGIYQKVASAFEWIKDKHSSFALADLKRHCAKYGLPVPSDIESVDARVYNHYLAFSAQQVAQASVIIGNMVAAGAIGLNQFVACTRVLKQAALDQQDGGFPMFNFLVRQFYQRKPEGSYISRLTGVHDSTLVKFIPQLNAAGELVVGRKPLLDAVANGFVPTADTVNKLGVLPSPYAALVKSFDVLFNNSNNDNNGGSSDGSPVVSGHEAAIEAAPSETISGEVECDEHICEHTSELFNWPSNTLTFGAEPGQYEIYTDGSRAADGTITWAFIVYDNGDPVHKANGTVPVDIYNDSWNITGEVWAVHMAIRWAAQHFCGRITIYHDYEGIGKWASGEWKAVSPIAKFYLNALSDRGEVSINFIKVKAHSDIVGNLLADQLARAAHKRETHNN